MFVKTTTKNNNPYSRPPPLDGSVKANKIIIAYGDGRFSPTMRGKRSGPTKTIIKALQKCKENRGVTVQMVDEYLNSQQSEKYILYYSVKKPLVA
ncbi:hypothetical protein BD408DRAFT_424966, partial [Parasitella parasitica]